MLDALLPFLMLGILIAAILTKPLARTRWVSLPTALLALGFISSEIWVSLGLDTGLRWQILSDLVFFLLLPVLIFEAAININARSLRREAVLIGSLAAPLLLLAIGIAAVITHYLMGATLSENWAVAVLIGSMICATDPTAISGALGDTDAARRIESILEGESLINDGTAITLFFMVSGLLAVGSQSDIGLYSAAGRFLLTMLGGAAVGVILGGLLDLVIAPANDKILSTSATLVLAFASFWVGEHLLGLSGVVATLAAGLTIAWRQRRNRSEEDIAFALDSWRILGFCANSMLFFAVGMSITVRMFSDHWLAMLIGIVAAVVSRAIIVFAGAGPISRFSPAGPLNFFEQNLMLWGGVRGAVAIALALSLSTDIPHWYAVQSTVYGVAIFSLVVQLPFLPGLAKKIEAKNSAPSGIDDRSGQR